MKTASVKAENWGFRYFSRSRYAIRHLNVTIEQGEKVLLLGASGSGKSTFLLGLSGLLSKNSLGEEEGNISLNGEHPFARRSDVAIVFQDPATSLVMGRIGDEVAFALENLGLQRDAIWRRVNAALDEVGLSYPLTHPTNALSGGEQQRLAVADLLAVTPSLWLLDEPTANLDPGGRKSLIETFFQLQERSNATIILVEHRLTQLIEMVNRVIVITDNGEGCIEGSPGEVFDNYRSDLKKAGIFLPDEFLVRHLPVSFGKEPVLKAEGLSASYPGHSELAIDDISLEISSHQVTAITGSNGSGKTTLALVLASLLKPKKGNIKFAALADSKSYFDLRARELVRHVGMVFQEPEHQFLTSNVKKELLVLSKRLKIDSVSAEAIADELLEKFRLTHLSDFNPFTLSGGEKRRLSVAAALVTDPKLLILDEPTFGQDANTFYELVRLLEEKKENGQAVVMVTHDLELLYLLADKVVELENGFVAREQFISPVPRTRADLTIASDLC